METNTPQDFRDIPNRTPLEFQKYQHIITDAIDWAHKNKDAPDYLTDEVAADIIIVSFLVSDFEWWSTKFLNIQRPARIMYRDPDTFWRTIAMAVSTPQIEQQCLIVRPDLDREKYFNHAFTMPGPEKIAQRLRPAQIGRPLIKRGELWKLDIRWDHLWPSSHKVFREILRRTQYPKRPGNFPWCQPGLHSLNKFTRVSTRQIKRALVQLERFKLLKRISRGYVDQGCAKYFVFLTPTMSRAFSQKSLHAKKNPRPKKRIREVR